MFLGVEIGGTKLQVGVCGRQGRLKHLVRTDVVRRAGRRGILHQLDQMIPNVLRRYDVERIGVGFGGPFDVERGRAVRSNQIAGWDGFPVNQWFENRFKLPTVVDNDQNCAGLAEAICGAGRGKRTVLYVTVGTGIGGGFILDGRIYNGRLGAAEIGHMKVLVGNRWRSIESVASGLAIERGTSTVVQSARHLGVAIANAIALLNPEIVIVGGGVSLAGNRFFRPLKETVNRLVFSPFRGNACIVPPALGQAVVVVGAALLAATRGGRCASVNRRGRRHEDGASQKRRYTGGIG